MVGGLADRSNYDATLVGIGTVGQPHKSPEYAVALKAVPVGAHERPGRHRESNSDLDIEGVPLDDSVRMWLKKIGQKRLLTPEQELEFARQAASGCERCKQIIVESNLRLVVSIAKKLWAGAFRFRT